jgi:glutaconyl-CoA/methylmalonyl-CoA decarboxylase subunit gamma
MSRWRVEVDGRSFDIEVEDRDADRYRVVVDGREHEVSLASLDEAAPAPPAPGVPAPRAVRSAATVSADVLGAPMPGLILRILVAPGAHVKRGQDLAVLEAMKMENIIRAPRDGVVAEVCARQGQQLGHGDAVIRFEPT